jgi:DNA-binding NarL/FixJ family response regulator
MQTRNSLTTEQAFASNGSAENEEPVSRFDVPSDIGRKHRLYILDDHSILRQALVLLLAKEPLLDVCGDAEDEARAIREIEATQPDLLIVGISSINCIGNLRLLSEFKERIPRMKTLIWLLMENHLLVERALRAGANGYLSKDEPFEQVADAIHKVLQNETYLSPLVARQIMEQISDGRQSPIDSLKNLSLREREVFELIGQGLTTQQIAGKLQLSPKTIETHRTRIKQKLDIKNGAQLNYRATHWALQKGG